MGSESSKHPMPSLSACQRWRSRIMGSKPNHLKNGTLIAYPAPLLSNRQDVSLVGKTPRPCGILTAGLFPTAFSHRQSDRAGRPPPLWSHGHCRVDSSPAQCVRSEPDEPRWDSRRDFCDDCGLKPRNAHETLAPVVITLPSISSVNRPSFSFSMAAPIRFDC